MRAFTAKEAKIKAVASCDESIIPSCSDALSKAGHLRQNLP
jgi:hypothetical protein